MRGHTRLLRVVILLIIFIVILLILAGNVSTRRAAGTTQRARGPDRNLIESQTDPIGSVLCVSCPSVQRRRSGR